MRFTPLAAAVASLSIVVAQSTSRTGRCGAQFGLTCSGSVYGSCCSHGSTSVYCGTGCQSRYSTSCTSGSGGGVPLKVSTDGSCAGLKGQTCLNSVFGNCCSQYGFCGKTGAYCGSGCNPAFGTCTNSPTSPNPGLPSSHVTTSTRVSMLASSAPPAPSPSEKVSTNARCGPKYGGQTCLGSRWGNCCSQYFYCGSTADYCRPESCQKGFGRCDGLQSSVLTSSTLATSTRLSSSSSSTLIIRSSSASISALSSSSSISNSGSVTMTTTSSSTSLVSSFDPTSGSAISSTTSTSAHSSSASSASSVVSIPSSVFSTDISSSITLSTSSSVSVDSMSSDTVTKLSSQSSTSPPLSFSNLNPVPTPPISNSLVSTSSSILVSSSDMMSSSSRSSSSVVSSSSTPAEVISSSSPLTSPTLSSVDVISISESSITISASSTVVSTINEPAPTPETPVVSPTFSSVVSSSTAPPAAPLPTDFCLRVATPNLAITGNSVRYVGGNTSINIFVAGPGVSGNRPIGRFNIRPSGQLRTTSGTTIVLASPPGQIASVLRESLNPTVTNPALLCAVSADDKLMCSTTRDTLTYRKFVVASTTDIVWKTDSRDEPTGIVIEFGIFYGAACIDSM